MASQTDFDEELAAGLKAAKSKRCCFALVMKGGADGALIVAKAKVPPAAIAEAKKKSGGSAVSQGICFYEDGKYIFELAKEPPATMARLIKTIAKRDAEMTINVECRMGTDAELADANGTDGAAATPPVAAATTTPAKAGFSTADFNKSRLSWDAAKKKIHGDMEKLNTAIRADLPEDATLGKELVEYIDEMLTSVDKNLEGALDSVVKAGTDADRQSAKAAALGVIDRYQKTVAINPGVKQVQRNPVMPINILTPLNATLDVIKRYLNA
jgi:hypothetical protein